VFGTTTHLCQSILPIALFIFAFTGGYKWVHWIGPCVGGCLFGLAMLLVYVSANSYIVDSYVLWVCPGLMLIAVRASTLQIRYLRSEVRILNSLICLKQLILLISKCDGCEDPS
jgi:hypothetical protein